MGCATPKKSCRVAPREVQTLAASAAAPFEPSRPAPEFLSTDQLEVEKSEDVMEFMMRFGSTTGGAGVDISKPKVLEVAEIWGDTVLDIRHYQQGGPPVTAGTSVGFRWRFFDSFAGGLKSGGNRYFSHSRSLGG